MGDARAGFLRPKIVLCLSVGKTRYFEAFLVLNGATLI